MLRQLFRALVVLSSLVAVAAWLAVALPAARGERPADPVEGAVLVQANRLLGHARADSAIAGTAHVAVMPGLPGAVALLVGVDHAKLWLVRQVALVATVFVAILVLAIVHLECGGWTLPLAAATLALVGPALLGPAPGSARPESIAFLFVLLGFATLRFSNGVPGALGASILLALGWVFHAPAAWFVLAAVLAVGLEDRRRAATLALACGVLLAGGSLAFARMAGPGFAATAWSEPLGALGRGAPGAFAFAVHHVFGSLGPSALVVVLSCAVSTQPWNERRGAWMTLAAAGLVSGLAASPGGSGDATLGPNLVAIVLVGAIALDLVGRHLADSFGTAGHEGESVIFAIVLVQFVVLLAAAPQAGWLGGALQTLLHR